MPIAVSTRSAVLAVLTLFLLTPAALCADESPTDQQKAEIREELNEAARENALLAANQKQAAAATSAPKPWDISVVTNYGYNRNVSYDSNRESDSFHQQTIGATYTEKHGELGFLPAGKYGIGGNYDQMFFYRTSSDYRNHKVNPFVTFDINKTLTYRPEYTFKSADYYKNPSIGYLSHEFKQTLTETRFDHWSHSVFSSLEVKDYRKKFALNASNGPTDDKYMDLLSEVGYSAVYFPSSKLVFGVTGSYKVNDSNDNFRNTGDYDGYKTTGFAYASLTEKISWVGAVGYDYKSYRDKRITSDDTKVEWDGFLYAASYLYYNISPKTQFVVSYLWDQNFSDDPLLQFNGSIVTAGFSVKI